MRGLASGVLYKFLEEKGAVDVHYETDMPQLALGGAGNPTWYTIVFDSPFSPKQLKSALIEAGEKRLRPILMTTMAMIFAMLPLALSDSLGSETKVPMAVAVIGGLLSSMILTLLVVPVIYKMINPLDRWLRKWYEKKIQINKA